MSLTRTLAFATLLLTACAGAEPEVSTQATGLTGDVAACVQFRERAYACRAPLMAPWIAARAKVMPPLAEALRTPEGTAEVQQVFLQELEADGAGPLAPRQARCEAVVAETPAALRPHLEAMGACAELADCGAWVACVVPAFEAMLAAR
jgi:hypothetical protein